MIVVVNVSFSLATLTNVQLAICVLFIPIVLVRGVKLPTVPQSILVSIVSIVFTMLLTRKRTLIVVVVVWLNTARHIDAQRARNV